MKARCCTRVLGIVLGGVVPLAFAVAGAWAAQETLLTSEEQLGKEIFFDKISDPDWVGCSTCHSPEVGWTGPTAGINRHGTVYRGAVPTRFGNRKPPSAAYAAFSPVFYYDEEEGLFIGGNFWNGRATGEVLGNPAADQARAPFLNPVEQNNPDKEAVCEQVANSKYADLFEQVWGPNSLDCTPGGVDATYNRIALSIAAYEASPEVNQFSSKYDAYLADEAELTDQEANGLALFNGAAMCANCHPSEPGPNDEPPLFTDYTFDNLGTPRNPENPFYDMDTVYLDDGTPINPLGAAWVDLGLGGFLKTRPEWADMAAENMGKQKVPTLRNVDKRYGGFPKAFGHNGYFKSLDSIVHFYNTRDVKDLCPEAFTTEKDALKQDCWPAPEVEDNVNDVELGNLGLTDEQEDAVVAFLRTLSDGYVPGKGKNKNKD
jgi:cytochrome c peroxidase